MKKRIEWIDISKYICIMCVIMNHIDGCPQPLINFFSPFYLSVFFFVSGYCYNHTSTFKEHLKKKTKQLFIPWFIFSNLNILVSHIYSYYGHDDLLTELWKNLLQVRGYGDYLWFIACLFVAYIPFYYFVKLDKKNKINSFLLLFIIFSIGLLSSGIRTYMANNNLVHIWGKENFLWHGEYIGESMFYMFCGYLCKKYDIDNKMEQYNTLINRIILLIVHISFVYIKYIVSTSFFRYFVFDALQSLVGIVLIVSFSKKIKINNYIKYVGMNTLIYFSFHNKVKTALLIVLERIIPSINEIVSYNIMYSTLYTIIFSIVISIVLIPITFVINKYFPWTIGRRQSDNALIK